MRPSRTTCLAEYLWILTCSRHNIAEKLLIWRIIKQQSLTHSLHKKCRGQFKSSHIYNSTAVF